MKAARKKEKDEFGCEYEYKPPENKRCPVCRREVRDDEINYIKEQVKKHPEVKNNDYN